MISYGDNNQFHVYECCPVCNEDNEMLNQWTIDACGSPIVCEVETKCKKCGHLNHWAYGHFCQVFIETNKAKEERLEHISKLKKVEG